MFRLPCPRLTLLQPRQNEKLLRLYRQRKKQSCIGQQQKRLQIPSIRHLQTLRAQHAQQFLLEFFARLDPIVGRDAQLHHFQPVVDVQPDFGFAVMALADIPQFAQRFRRCAILADVEMHAARSPLRRREKNARWFPPLRPNRRCSRYSRIVQIGISTNPCKKTSIFHWPECQRE